MPVKPLPKMTKQLLRLSEKLDTLNTEVKELKSQKDVLEKDIIKYMENEGLAKVSCEDRTLSINKAPVPQAKDWNEIYKYIQRNKFWHLLERRLSVSGYRELKDTGKKTPGVEFYERITLGNSKSTK